MGVFVSDLYNIMFLVYILTWGGSFPEDLEEFNLRTVCFPVVLKNATFCGMVILVTNWKDAKQGVYLGNIKTDC